MATGVKVTIDREGCTSCGSCWEICPQFFEQNPEDDWSQVVAGFRTNNNLSAGIAPPDLESCVREAADSCPVEVIEVQG